MDKKYGVYICTGCGIGDALDIEALSGVASEEGLPVQTHPFLCSQAGVATIKQDVEEKGTNTMVIAACSRRVNFDTFRFVGSTVERVNLREGGCGPTLGINSQRLRPRKKKTKTDSIVFR